MKKILPFLFLLLSSSFAFAETPAATPIPLPVTPAPATISITAIPPRLELSGLPGTTLQESLKVGNASNEDMAVQASFTNFIVNDNQGTPVPVDETVSGRWSLASWITVTPQKILLKSKDTHSVTIMINIPKNALPGGHYAMVTYQPDTTGLINGQGSGSSIVPKVGTLVYLNVLGPVTEAANLKTFSVDQPFKNYGPTAILAEIENLGDIHIQPKGNLTITNLFNQTVFSQSLEAKNIFPFASRQYNFSFPGKWHLGRYAAHFNAAAGNSQIPLNGLIYFWIVPVKELAAVIAILMAIIILIAFKTKNKRPVQPANISQEKPVK